MTPVTGPNPPQQDIRRLFEPSTVAAVLRDILSGALRSSRTVQSVRVERCWPGRRGEFSFEWSFTFGRARRHTLFGLIPDTPPAAYKQEPPAATIIRGRLSGVRRYLPEWRLLVHSPDCDPGMPHVAECLDAKRMAVHLRPLWGPSRDPSASSRAGIECRVLGYRSGKRAVIAYRLLGSRRLSDRFLGKTFRDGRAERLAETHRQLNDQLASYSNNRVRVPVPDGCLPGLRMTLFSWVTGRRVTCTAIRPADEALAAVDVLTALHRTSIDGVPPFSVADECEIVSHWHKALQRVNPSSAAATSPLVDRLRKIARTVEPTAQCTIHRDFYDRQLIVGRRTTVLLDLDTLALGSPTIDLGNLLAHVYLTALEAGRSQRQHHLLADELVSRYEQQVAPVDRRALTFFRATALFRVGAVHALRTATRRHAPAMWAAARQILKAPAGSSDRPVTRPGSPETKPQPVATREST